MGPKSCLGSDISANTEHAELIFMLIIYESPWAPDLCQLNYVKEVQWWDTGSTMWPCPLTSPMTLTPPGGVLGWVSDRDAQHRSLTRNATKGQKGGSKLYISPSFDKKRVEIRHFPHFCSNIGVKIIQIFQRPEKGGSKWRSICSNLHRVSTLPGP